VAGGVDSIALSDWIQPAVSGNDIAMCFSIIYVCPGQHVSVAFGERYTTLLGLGAPMLADSNVDRRLRPSTVPVAKQLHDLGQLGVHDRCQWPTSGKGEPRWGTCWGAGLTGACPAGSGGGGEFDF